MESDPLTLGENSSFGNVVVNPYPGNVWHGQQPTAFKGLMARGAWRPEMGDFMRQNNIEALYLNYVNGWEGDDLSFLEKLPFLKELKVVIGVTTGAEAITSLSNLQRLSLSTFTKSRIDFSKLKSLKKCFVSWFRGADTLFEAPSLEDIYLDKPPKEFPERIEDASKFKAITLGNTPFRSLEFISSQRDTLTKLELLNCRKIASLEPISTLTRLEWLNIDGSPLPRDLEFLRPLKQLEVLLLSGRVEFESVEPVADLKNLRACALAGSISFIDGNLAPLTTLPKLAMLNFNAKKHYSHKLVKKWNWENVYHPDTLLAPK